MRRRRGQKRDRLTAPSCPLSSTTPPSSTFFDDAMTSRIYLAGFMGSGKSTVAPIVGEMLGYEALELDERIVERVGRPIPAIFEQGGEEAFRRIERAMLEETADEDEIVVSLGGGAVTVSENLEFVRAHGLMVYLEVSVETLTDRLYGLEGRPLLQDEEGELLSKNALRDRIGEMLEERTPYYEKAHVTVDADGPRPEETAARIVDRVREEAGRP